MYDRERERVDELIRQREALGWFGEFALKSDNLDEILTEACRLVGEALGTELAKVLEAQDGEAELLVRAGVGWKPGVVGQVRVPTGSFSAAGHALLTGEPIISVVEKEDRFEIPSFMIENGVKSMVNTIIVGPDGQFPYGVLEVDSRAHRDFSEDDVNFLRSYANVIASAVGRFQVTQQLHARADEKRRLMQELQHRVKNNFQVVSSLVRLQAVRSSSAEVKSELASIGRRIETLRIVHGQLHEVGSTEQVDLGNYLDVLVSSLFQFQGEEAQSVECVKELVSVVVSSDLAVPLGMIVNEFMTNSLKYAFDGGPGKVGIRLEAPASNRAEITLWDDGKGLSEGGAASTGMQLIRGFARQLRAEPVWSSSGGARLSLILPLEAITSQTDTLTSERTPRWA